LRLFSGVPGTPQSVRDPQGDAARDTAIVFNVQHVAGTFSMLFAMAWPRASARDLCAMATKIPEDHLVERCGPSRMGAVVPSGAGLG
jgi:hypothetical protein